MGLLDKMLPGVNLEEIEKKALEARQAQLEMLQVLKDVLAEIKIMNENFHKFMSINR